MAEEPEETVKDRSKVSAKATGDLGKVTDYVEEREMDSSKVADSMRAMLNTSTNNKSEKEDHLNVKIQQADVDTIVDELDLDRKDAENALRNAKGNLIEALIQLVR